MLSKKLFQNGEAAPGGSEGRHGNRWTNGIVLALSGLAAVVSVVAVLFMARELSSVREQQTALMREIRDQQTAFQADLREELQAYLKDQVQMQLKQENEAEVKTGVPLGPERRDHSATFWKRAEVPQRFKRDTMDNPNELEEFLRGFGCHCHDGARGPRGPPGPPGRCGCSRPDFPVKPDKPDRPVVPRGTDCSTIKAAGRARSGVYTLGSPLRGVKVYCDMDTAGGGWTVIQRRMDGSVAFNRNWDEYKRGFGNIAGEYWLGNENIHRLTTLKDYRLRVDMMDWNGESRYAEYNTFRVAGESDNYRLTISGYSGTAKDDMSYNNGQKFSTIDRDNDARKTSCSQERAQAGWWFKTCTWAHPNGRYLGNCGNNCTPWQGVIWYYWRGVKYSLKSISMKIRPR